MDIGNLFSKDNFIKFNETAKLRIQYLYSVAKERKIEAEDIEKSIGSDTIQDQVLTELTKKVYLNLEHDEQVTLLENGFQFLTDNAQNVDTFEELFNSFAEPVDSLDVYDQVDDMVVKLTNIVNVILETWTKKLERLPAPLFKKCVMILIKDGIDPASISEKIIRHMKSEEDKKFDSVKDDPEQLTMLLLDAYTRGDVQLAEKYAQMLRDCKDENGKGFLEGFGGPPNNGDGMGWESDNPDGPGMGW